MEPTAETTTLNKSAIIDSIASAIEGETKNKISKKDLGRIVDALISTVQGAMSEGREVNLSGIGRFYTRERAQRNGVNPQTREKIVIPAKTVVAYKMSKSLKDCVEN